VVLINDGQIQASELFSYKRQKKGVKKDDKKSLGDMVTDKPMGFP